MYYSQNDEEKIITDYFAARGRKTGTFADLGACDGKSFSNTRRLFELGWGGVMVEADPRHFADLATLYRDQAWESRVELVNAALDVDRGCKKFFAMGGATSSFSEKHAKKWMAAGDKHVPVWLHTVTIFDVMNAKAPPWHFITIDLETWTWTVLQHMNLRALGCECICIEFDDRAEDVKRFAASFGLQQIAVNGENLIFGLP